MPADRIDCINWYCKCNLRNENQNLTSENQEAVRQIEDNRRISENKSKAMKQYISDLSKVQEQQEQNVNMLSDRIAKLYNKEHVRNLLTQNEAGYPKKVLIKIALQSVLATLRAQPNRYDIIFNDNNSTIMTVSNNEYEESIVAMTQAFGRDLLNQAMSQTIETLELEAEAETGTETEIETDAEAKAEDIEGGEEVTGSTETKAEAAVENTEAAAAKEEEEEQANLAKEDKSAQEEAESESEDIEEDIASTETKAEAENIEAAAEEETKPEE